MKRQILVLVLLLSFLYSCDQKDFKKESGQIESFAEMVKSGVKPLALGPPMTSAELDLFMPEVERICEKYGIEFYREDSLVQTDLFPSSSVEGKEVVLFFKGNTLNAYQDLKQELAKDELSASQKRELSRRFGRLLGYPTDRINDLLAENSAFRDLEDFGIQGSRGEVVLQGFGQSQGLLSNYARSGTGAGIRKFSQIPNCRRFLFDASGAYQFWIFWE